MLIEFRFKNYRSFRDETTLSMEATGLGTCLLYTSRQTEHRQHPVPQSWAGTGQSLVVSLTFAHYFQII